MASEKAAVEVSGQGDADRLWRSVLLLIRGTPVPQHDVSLNGVPPGVIQFSTDDAIFQQLDHDAGSVENQSCSGQ